MKRSIEPNDSKSKISKVWYNLDDIPIELISIIILFMDTKELLNFILTCSAFYNEFMKLYQESIYQIRLWYLNRKKYDRKHNSRLIKLYKTKEEILSFKKEFEVTYLLQNNDNVNRYILDEIYSYNKQCKTKFIISGGCISKVLFGYNTKNNFVNRTPHDIDIFYITHDNNQKIINQEIHSFFRNIHVNIANKNLDFLIVKTSSNIINVKSKYIDMQFIFRKISTIEELLIFFDLDCCRFAFDGEDVYTTIEGKQSLKNHLNIIPKQQKMNERYVNRVLKYGMRDINSIFYELHPLYYLHEKNYLGENYKRLIKRENFGKFDIENPIDKDDLYLSIAFISFDQTKEIYNNGIDCIYYDDHSEERYLRNETHNIITQSFNIYIRFDSLFHMYTTYYFGRYDDNHLLKKYSITKCKKCHIYIYLNKSGECNECFSL